MNDLESVKQAANEMYANTEIPQERPAALLLGGVAINLAVIAEAITKLVKDNPDPTKPESLRSLTDDERRVVEALRQGDLEFIKYHDPSAMNGAKGYIKGTIPSR